MSLVIAVEGLSNAGKTEAVAHTANSLKHLTPPIQAAFELTSPPGRVLDELFRAGSPISPRLKAMLFAADRTWLLQELTMSACNTVTIFDRYVYSNLIYRTEEGIDPAWIEALEKDCPDADLGILVEIDPQISLTRAIAAGNPMPYSGAFLSRVAERYHALAVERGWVVIDGTDDIEAVKSSVARVVEQYIASIAGG